MYIYHRNLILRKKLNRPRATLNLAGVEKGKVIPDIAASKSDFLRCRELSFRSSVRIRGPNCKDTKNLS